MDIARVPKAQTTRMVMPALVLLAVLAIGLAAWRSAVGLWRPGADRPIDRSSVVTARVTRGTFVRSVQGAGVLTPQFTKVIAAPLDEVIDTVAVHPGSRVRPGDVIARGASPELEAAVAEATGQIAIAQAELANVRAHGLAGVQSARGELGAAGDEQRLAAAEYRVYSDLNRQGLVGSLAFERARMAVVQARRKIETANGALGIARAESDSAVTQQLAKIATLTQLRDLKRRQLARTTIVADADGVVQDLAVQPGQHVSVGAVVAHVADARDLEAVVQVPEADAHDVVVGQPARIGLRDIVIPGRVQRLNPVAQNGTVAVHLTLAGPLPAGARPDMNVTGEVVLERFPGALSVQRPVGVQDGARVESFRVVGDRAVRTSVTFGRGTLDRIVVVNGARAGDELIVSDTSAFAASSAVQLRL
jgi:multidrug efflux pump subunit AcrA (membrane-fusion protein)